MKKSKNIEFDLPGLSEGRLMLFLYLVPIIFIVIVAIFLNNYSAYIKVPVILALIGLYIYYIVYHIAPKPK